MHRHVTDDLQVGRIKYISHLVCPVIGFAAFSSGLLLTLIQVIQYKVCMTSRFQGLVVL